MSRSATVRVLLCAVSVLGSCSPTGSADGEAGRAGGASSGGAHASGSASSGSASSGSASSGSASSGGGAPGSGSLGNGGLGSGGLGSDAGGAQGDEAGAHPSAGGRTGAGGQTDAGGTNTGSAPGSGGDAELDGFGITKLYPSDATQAEWTSAHYDHDYEVAFGTDTADPSGLSGARGDGTLLASAGGELVMSGSEPRLYVNEDAEHSWRDVEITVYYQRVTDSGTAYAGLVVGARSGADGHTMDGACDAHTYYARVRNDGAFDFEKELKHPASATQARAAPAQAWPPNGEVPRETWIGWKFVLYNLEGGAVQLEAYRDLTEGAEGGTWELVNETVDDGGWFVETDCASHSPEDGESDLIVQGPGSVLIRNTNVTEARYRSISVRAIQGP